MFSHYLVILNPIAGKGLSAEKVPVVRSFFEDQHASFEIVKTEGVGHATEIAREHACDEATAVVAAGGDGTCNEVINGLMRGKGENLPVLGVLPLGRGNDFSFGGHIPADLGEALAVLIDGKAAPFDLGLVVGGDYPDGRYFGNGIGVGFDTMVGLEAARMPRIHDAMAYVFGTAKTLVKFSDSPEIEVDRDGEISVLRAIQISIMNGTRMGGLFYMAPDAVQDDGQLDLCSVTHLTWGKLIKTIFHFTKGTQRGLPGVSMERGSSFVLKARDGAMAVHADGETICVAGKDISVSVVPGALRILRA